MDISVGEALVISALSSYPRSMISVGIDGLNGVPVSVPISSCFQKVLNNVYAPEGRKISDALARPDGEPETAIFARRDSWDRTRALAMKLVPLGFRRAVFPLIACILACSAPAQCASPAEAPGFWDPHARPAKPDLANLHSLRFLTEDDYPPFHFATPDGALTGFDVDLARAICDDLKLSCTIQARRFDTLINSLDADQGDAIIAAIRIDQTSRAALDFTAPYSKNPARFLALKSTPLGDATPEILRSKIIGVVARTAHEAFLATFFKASVRKPFDSPRALTDALVKGEVDAVFGDGLALSFWLQGATAHDCCAFLGGPYLDSRFFGEGVAIAVKKDNFRLRDALDFALYDLWTKGVYTDLYLKYFPLGFF